MITPEQIQTVLNLVAKAPTTMSEAMRDGPAVAALIQLGQGLQQGALAITAVTAVDSLPPAA